MKNLANLLNIEFIFIKRNLTNFIMGLGFPVIFFILFSGMQQFDDPETKVRVVKDMLISMTAFSSISFALFSLPISIKEDEKNNYLHILNNSGDVLGRGDQNTPGCTTQQAESLQKALSSI